MVNKTTRKQTSVKCNVDSCDYWGSGNICEANEIMVNNNVGETNMEIGALGSIEASTSEETMCATYKPKTGQ